MAIKFDKLFVLLEKEGISTYKIRKDNIVSQAAFQKMRTGTGDIDTRSINRLCAVLNCQPGDIMSYEPDTPPEPPPEE